MWRVLVGVSRVRYKLYLKRDRLIDTLWRTLYEIGGYSPIDMYITRIIYRYTDDDLDDITNKFQKPRKSVNMINIRGGKVEVYSHDIDSAIKLRNIGHLSGFKYSRIVPSRYPKVIIEGTENIIIYNDINSSLHILLKKVFDEVFEKNLKRFNSLNKKIEKLKY